MPKKAKIDAADRRVREKWQKIGDDMTAFDPNDDTVEAVLAEDEGLSDTPTLKTDEELAAEELDRQIALNWHRIAELQRQVVKLEAERDRLKRGIETN